MNISSSSSPCALQSSKLPFHVVSARTPRRTILPIFKSEPLFNLIRCPYGFVVRLVELTYIAESILEVWKLQEIPSAHLYNQRRDSLSLRPCITVKIHRFSTFRVQKRRQICEFSLDAAHRPECDIPRPDSEGSTEEAKSIRNREWESFCCLSKFQVS